MSILIKGMEMPKDCPMCPLAHWDATDHFTGCNIVCGKKYAMSDKEYADSNTRPDWCPLVPVPQHGRLIDADALMEKVEHDVPLSTVFEKTMRIYLKNAPTIIEAEESEA